MKTIEEIKDESKTIANVLLVDSFCFSQKFWLAAVISSLRIINDKLKLK